MHIIALVCQKGGAGKTTMAIHLAVEGQRRGLKSCSSTSIPGLRGQDYRSARYEPQRLSPKPPLASTKRSRRRRP